MPGRNPPEAFEAFLAPLRQTLSCITAAQWLYRPADPRELVQALTLSEDPLELRDTSGATLRLSLQQQYVVRRIGSDEPKQIGPWKVSTRAYRYKLEDTDGRELISWHWHPRTAGLDARPHIHVPDGPLGNRHLPTGRVGLESVVRFALLEMHVRPRRADWGQVLDNVQKAFETYRTWP